MSVSSTTGLGERIEAIESGYEFLLAYAAQGRETDKGSGQDVRSFLQSMNEALTGLGDACKIAAETKDGDRSGDYSAFLDAVDNDARSAQGVIRMVLVCEDISSQLVDNLNTNVHLRALLTDLFVIDDALN